MNNITEKKEPLKGLETINQKLHTAMCILMLLETDLSMEQPDGVTLGAINVIHKEIQSAQEELKKLL